MKSDKKILMLIKNNSIEYDDRLIKSALSVKKLGFYVKIIALEQNNKKKKGKIHHIEYKTISLFLRRITKPQQLIALKLIELYIKFLIEIITTKAKILYLHDVELIGLVPILQIFKSFRFIEKIIWDKHELSSNENLNNPKYVSLLKKSLKVANVVIEANQERIDFLLDKLELQLQHKFKVINNYPSEIYVKKSTKKLPSNKFSHWLNKEQYAICISPTNKNRYFKETVKAFVKSKKIKLLIVGSFSNEHVNYIKKEFGEKAFEIIYFIGMLKQEDLLVHIKNALFNVILYSTNEYNTMLCAPNRLYQSISIGTPVLVGCNPTLKNEVQKLKNGIVLKTDGRDYKDIIEKIDILLSNYRTYKQNADNFINKYTWEEQENIFKEILN